MNKFSLYFVCQNSAFYDLKDFHYRDQKGNFILMEHLIAVFNKQELGFL